MPPQEGHGEQSDTGKKSGKRSISGEQNYSGKQLMGYSFTLGPLLESKVWDRPDKS